MSDMSNMSGKNFHPSSVNSGNHPSPDKHNAEQPLHSFSDKRGGGNYNIMYSISFRLLASLLITAVFVFTVCLTSSAQYTLDTALFLFLPTLLSLYVFSGIFCIEGMVNKMTISLIVALFFSYQIFKNINAYHYSVGLSIYASMIFSAIFLLALRSMIFLITLFKK